MGAMNPLGLIWAASLGVLVLLYLWQRTRNRLEVPSLLLWESVPIAPMQRRRFRPDWLFALQAAALGALAFGLARPYVKGPAVAGGALLHVLVVDTSASMQAKEGRQTRFDQALEMADRVLRDFHPGDEAMLIAAAARPRIAAEFTSDRAALLRVLHALEPVDTGTNLQAAVALAQRARERDPARTEILLFTDLPATALDPADRDIVRRFGVGESGDNLSIAGLQILQGPFEDPARARAYVSVQNHSYAERHGFLSVAAEREVVTRTGFTIPGRGLRTFAARNFRGPGLVTAQIETGDALAADDRAHGWLRPARTLRVLLVSEPSAIVDDVRSIARAVPALQLSVVSPDEYGNGGDGRFEVVIFHRVAPMPAASGALYIYPPAENPVFAVAGQATGVDVIDWDERHPALSGLRPVPPWPLQAATVVQPPAGARPLLWSRTAEREFPLAFVHESGGRRVACLAFDLEAERLLSGDNVPLVVLVLNLIDWLAPADERAPAVVAAGGVYEAGDLPPDLPLRVTDPRGRTSDVPAGVRRFETNFAGIYRIGANGTDRTAIANFFDAAESDIGRAAREPVPALATAPAEPVRVAREFGWWMYLAAAIVLFAEWAAWRRRA